MITWEEYRAIERYFLETGKDFVKLSPTERRKLIEAEYERRNGPNDGEIEGNLSPIPGNYSGNRGFDIT